MPLRLDEENEALNGVELAIYDICRTAKQSPSELFGAAIREALDEVIDGPRTGRWSIDQLDPPEQSYIGTKLEIIVRNRLGADRGRTADCVIGGLETEIKWSRYFAAWMIGPENVGAICLGLCTDVAQRTFSVGLFVPFVDRLRKSGNRDKKLQLSAHARDKHVRWIVDRQPLQPNFIAELTDEDRSYVFAGGSAQERVRRLAERVQRRFIPRCAFETAAMRKGDPMRRLRADRYNAAGLGGLRLLSTKYKERQVRELLNISPDQPLPADCWVSIDSATYLRRFGED